ncbi:MAG: TolB family protein [Flavobacteriales bacterium]
MGLTTLLLALLGLPFVLLAQNGRDTTGKKGKFTPLGDSVNSSHEDYAPVLTLEENLLFFTSDRPIGKKDESGNSNIFLSSRSPTGEWKKPELLPFNTEKEEVSVGISPDGKTLFIHRDGDLFKVKRTKDGWKELEPLPAPINSEHEEFHGSMSSDANAFYFVSDRRGDRNIFRVKRMPTEEWSKAQQLPSPINTSGPEYAPFIHPDRKTLFFSSKVHTNTDEPDIYYSKKKGKGKWTEPVNMGYPLSTKGKNIYIMTSADGKRAYFASNSVEKDGEDRDLYRHDLKGSFTEGLAVLKGFIDAPSGSDLLDSVRIHIKRPEGMKKKKRPWVQRPRERDGVFIAVLPPCHKYHLSYKLGKEEVMQQEVYIPCRSSYQTIRKEVFLEPVEFNPSQLDRRPSLIGKVRYASSGAPVSKGTLHLLGKEGAVQDSISIGSKGEFSFYHPSADPRGLIFHLEKEGGCENTHLKMRSGGKTYEPKEREGCEFHFPIPQ